LGQKVHPVGFRLGIIRPWASKWYAEKNYSEWLHEDIRIRKYLEDRFQHTGISKVEIERMAKIVLVTIHTAKPGIVIGKRGSGIDGLREEIKRLTECDVRVNIQEVRKAELDAKLVAEGIATQLERRVAFRRAMKKAVQTSMKFGAQGIRINCAGRLGGADMGRREWYLEGRVPLHTLRADIDYGVAEAKTTYGIIGIKVWIFKGEVLEAESRF
jgi:small subunit ribosomal protein S3